MTATLPISALSPTETQLELVGTYAAPFVVIGEAVDAVAMRRIVEESAGRRARDCRAALAASQATG